MDKALELCAYRSRVVTTKQGLLDKIMKAKNACKLTWSLTPRSLIYGKWMDLMSAGCI